MIEYKCNFLSMKVQIYLWNFQVILSVFLNNKKNVSFAETPQVQQQCAKNKFSVFQINFVIQTGEKNASNSKFIAKLGNLGYRLRDALETRCFWLEESVFTISYLRCEMWINSVGFD